MKADMRRFIRWAKEELLHVLPAFLFFFVTFNLINIIEKSLLKRAGISPVSFLTVTLAVAVIAKVLLVTDHLPFVNLFQKKPLIYRVVWKSFVYWAITLAVKLTIRFAPYLFEHEALVREYDNFVQNMDWSLFAAIQAFYCMFFFIYVISREFILVIGTAKTRKLFFGR